MQVWNKFTPQQIHWRKLWVVEHCCEDFERTAKWNQVFGCSIKDIIQNVWFCLSTTCYDPCWFNTHTYCQLIKVHQVLRQYSPQNGVPEGQFCGNKNIFTWIWYQMISRYIYVWFGPAATVENGPLCEPYSHDIQFSSGMEKIWPFPNHNIGELWNGWPTPLVNCQYAKLVVDCSTFIKLHIS